MVSLLIVASFARIGWGLFKYISPSSGREKKMMNWVLTVIDVDKDIPGITLNSAEPIKRVAVFELMLLNT